MANIELLKRINECNEEELDNIITETLNQKIAASEPIEKIGFTNGLIDVNAIHKGFINPKTRIKFATHTMNSYSMKTMDYFYEFARYLRNSKIKNTGSLVMNIETFINNYFGINESSNDYRDNYFDSLAFNTTETDDEYFAKLDNLEIGDLKGKKLAMCTERAALAQNLLSFFDIESYYCMGCVNNDGREEPHCFNIAKGKKDYRLLDYSIPTPIYRNGEHIGWAPFQATINPNEVEKFMSSQQSKDFADYEYAITDEGIIRDYIGLDRQYVVGAYELAHKHTR